MAEVDSGAGDAAYPWQWAADVVLRDGASMHIRPIRPEDADALQRMHVAQSPESIYFRFFAPVPRLGEKDLYRFTHVDHHNRVALVLVQGEEIRAVGRFDVVAPGEAEVAFNVADTEQGRGLGSVLLEHLAAAARELGVTRFVADVLPANARMVRVFSDAGYEVRQRLEDGVLSISFSIEETERSWRVMAERERHAEALSMRGLLQAGSVLVLGLGPAAQEGQVLAARAAQALTGGGFTGAVHLVGLSAGVGVPAAVGKPAGGPSDGGTDVRHHASLDDVPAPVDLAVVAGPPDDVVDAVPGLHARGVRALVVLSHGFGESGAEGMARQRELLRRTREAGIRVAGPASFGVVGQGPAGRYNATLWVEDADGAGRPVAAPVPAPRSAPAPASASAPAPAVTGLGLFAQSLAQGLALRSTAARRGLPVATFLSSGNRVDVSGNDTMQFWSTHDATAVGAMVLESIGNPRKFSRIARRLSASTPVVAMVSGQTGQVTPPGHAVRTSRQPQRVLTEMLRQAGVVRARTLREMLDVAALLLAQPLPAGPRTAIVSSSAALAGLVADVARADGLEVAVRPVTLPALAGPRAVRGRAARADRPGGLRRGDRRPRPTAGHHRHRRRRGRRRGCRPRPAHLGGLPLRPARAHGPADRGGRRRARRWPPSRRPWVRWPAPCATRGGAPAPRTRSSRRPASTRRPPAGCSRRRWPSCPAGRAAPWTRPTTQQLLACYGIAVLPASAVTEEDEAVAAAERIGWPVALKVADQVLRHRVDLGGVRLDLADADSVREAMSQMRTRAQHVLGRATAFEVQAMAPPGVACVVRGAEDDLYGPVVSFGLGGDATELLGDVSYRIPPLTERGRLRDGALRAGRAPPARPPRPAAHRRRTRWRTSSRACRCSPTTCPRWRRCSSTPSSWGRRRVQIASAVVDRRPPAAPGRRPARAARPARGGRRRGGSPGAGVEGDGTGHQVG